MRLTLVVFGGLMMACAGLESSEGDVEIAAAIEKPPPAGRWEGDETCGETVGGTPVAVYFSLEINDGSAHLTADGYQTAIDIHGRVEDSGEGDWQLVFDRNGEFSSPFKPAEVLFTLQEKGGGLAATPVEWVLNCSEVLALSPSTGG
ncbi:MAG: DUF5991 domain-containing protein [Myxococcota bacterium]